MGKMSRMENRDAVKWLEEQVTALRKDYVAEELRELGYNDEFQQSHKSDFVTVHMGDGVFGVVYVPEKQVLFWFEEKVREKRRLNAAYAENVVMLVPHCFYGIGEEALMQEQAVYAALRARGQYGQRKDRNEGKEVQSN